VTTPVVAVFEHFTRGLGESTRTNGLAYGYSVLITSTFGVVHALDGGPDVVQCVLFAVGTSIVFAVLGAIVTRGFQQRVEREPPVVVSLAAALSIISICTALGAAILVSWAVRGSYAWFAAPLAASAVYLVASGFESALARGVHAVVGTDNLEQR
jgi:uncharacterized membrane protein